jgi:Na+/melibiose symporter-like transporter
MTEQTAGPRLDLTTKLGYGFGMMATTVTGTALSAGVMTVYLNQVIGLPVALVGLAIMLSLIFDAVVDPLIGLWSDATNTCWGRRHPFIYAAAIPCGVFIYLLWHTPADWPKPETFAYIVAILIAVRFFAGMYDTTSAALAPELTSDYHERTRLMGYRFLFNTGGGAVMAMVLYLVFLRRDATHPLGILNRAGYQHYGVLAAIIIALAILVAGLSTHKLIPSLSTAQKREGLKDQFREVVGTLSNPSLLVMMACGLAGGTGNGITFTMQNYFYLYFWELAPQTRGLLVLAGLPAAIFGSMLTPILSKKLGKKYAMVLLFMLTVVIGLAPMTFRLLNIFPPNGSPWVFVILFADTFVAAALAMMGYVLLTSMVADVVEDAAVTTGRRSEGLLFSANNLVPKLSVAVGGFLATLMLAAVHFPAHAQQGEVSPAIMRHLALIYVPTAASLSVISILVLLLYGIDEKKHQKNVATLTEQGLTNLAIRTDDITVAPLDPVLEAEILARPGE